MNPAATPSASPLRPPAPRRWRSWRPWLVAAAVMLGGAVLSTAAGWLAFRKADEEIRQAGDRRLEFLTTELASALEKYETLPSIAALHPEFARLLLNPQDPARREASNQILELMAEQAKVSAIYVLDPSGLTLASSNWRTPRSFVGQNYAFRPYFRGALAGGLGRFYAVGATSGEPGYFLAHPIYRDRPDAGQAAERRQPIGVVAVKISLDEVERRWEKSGELLMLADAAGVVFLTSHPAWKFRALAPLDEAARGQLQSTQQYGKETMAPLQFRQPPQLGDGVTATSLAFADRPQQRAQWQDFALAWRPVGRLDWRLILLAPLNRPAEEARQAAMATALAYTLAIVAILYGRLRRRRRHELLVARRELERARASLEAQIVERTSALVTANRELEHKIAELDRTQAVLRETQNDLVQAGKLTVLGQMAATITHEINQPLAAIRALADNAQTFLDRRREQDARQNLQHIGGLTDRIATIVGELKGFARREDGQREVVPLSPVIARSLLLISPEVERARAEINAPTPPADLCVLGQATRIEQVLVNLLRNAIDAVRDQPVRQVTLQVEADGERVRIQVRDSGPGIPHDAFSRLFEPFYTTKPAGQGLGLGLTVSASIAHALGGELTAENLPGGGAAFTLILARPDTAGPAAPSRSA